MKSLFQPLEITDKKIFETYASPSSVFSCDQSFAVQYLWKDYYQSEYAIIGELLFIKGNEDNKSFFFPPLGSRIETLPQAIHLLQEQCHKKELSFIKCLDKDLSHFQKNFPGKITYSEERDYFEYIYSHEKYFTNKRLKQKVRYFERDHHPEIVLLTGNNCFQYREEILQFYKKWIGRKSGLQHTMALKESDLVIDHIFESFDEIGLSGLIVKINQTLTGFYIGWKPAGNSMGFALFVKADITIDYHSDALFYYGSKYLFPECEFVNWDRDGGLTGLRFFKERYHPHQLLKSYRITVSE